VSDDGGAADPRARVRLALQAQLRSWRAALDSGAASVGWKVGLNVAEVEEVMGSEPVFGHLTSATCLEPGGTFRSRSVRALRAEAEVAVELGQDVRAGDGPEAVRAAVVGLAPALELVDVEPPAGGFEGVVADNVYHRAFVLGPARTVAPGTRLAATLRVNGEVRDTGATSEDFAAKLLAVARQLGEVGEALRAGDSVITGSLTHVPVRAGDTVEVAIAPSNRCRSRSSTSFLSLS
jgi:2-oxo-3-hexenedioate decarboxylase